jgi:hypothetical protein
VQQCCSVLAGQLGHQAHMFHTWITKTR